MDRLNLCRVSVFLCLLFLTGCHSTSHETGTATLGTAASMNKLKAALHKPGPIVFEKHIAADWIVPLAGLVNLDHPKAKESGLEDQDEEIQIYTYSLTHPVYGTYLVDSGISENFIDAANNADVSWLVKMAMNTSALKVRTSTAAIKENFPAIKGVFLTHIHPDHIMGFSDLPGTPVYLGPGDTKLTNMKNMAAQGTTDRLLGYNNSLLEWQFGEEGIIDIFGDGSVWAIHAPGHTPGSTAYIAITAEGPEIMIGDATHTRWGWIHGVEPGGFSENISLSKQSLNKLRILAEQTPGMEVHPGHQSL